jgi:hypothetical protein
MSESLRRAAQDIINYSEDYEAGKQGWPEWDKKFDALKAALAETVVCSSVQSTPAQTPAPPNCSGCANADSWGLPDKAVCKTCVAGSKWAPLNVGSVNRNTPPAQTLLRWAFKAMQSYAAAEFATRPLREC